MSAVSETSDNHAKAVESAALVKALRDFSPDLKIIYVNENGVLIGEKSAPGASCTLASDGRDLQEAYPPK